MSIKKKTKTITSAATGDNLGITPKDYSKEFEQNLRNKEKEDSEGYGFNLGDAKGSLTQQDLYDIWGNYEASEGFTNLSNKQKDAQRKAFTSYLNNFRGSTLQGTPGLEAMEQFTVDNDFMSDLKNRSASDKSARKDYENLMGVIRVLGAHKGAGTKLTAQQKATTETAKPTETTPAAKATWSFDALKDITGLDQGEDFAHSVYGNITGFTPEGTAYVNPLALGGYGKQAADYYTRKSLEASQHPELFDANKLTAITQSQLAYQDALNSGDPTAINTALTRWGMSLGLGEREARLLAATNKGEVEQVLYKPRTPEEIAQQKAYEEQNKRKKIYEDLYEGPEGYYTAETGGTKYDTSGGKAGNYYFDETGKLQQVGVQFNNEEVPLTSWTNYQGPKYIFQGREYDKEGATKAFNDYLAQNPEAAVSNASLVSQMQQLLNQNVDQHAPLFNRLTKGKSPITGDNSEQNLYQGIYENEEFKNTPTDKRKIFDVSEYFNLSPNQSITVINGPKGPVFSLFEGGKFSRTITPQEAIAFGLLDEARPYQGRSLRSAQTKGAQTGKNMITRAATSTALMPFGNPVIADLAGQTAGKLVDYFADKYQKGGSLALPTYGEQFTEQKPLEFQHRATNLGDIIEGGPEGLSSADMLDIFALIPNLASAGLAGKSAIASGVVGAGGTLSTLGANLLRGQDWKTTTGQALGGLALDAASMVPVFGQAAGLTKAAKAIKTVQKPLTWALKAYGFAGAADIVGKLASGNWKDISTTDINMLAGGIMGLKRAYKSGGLKALGSEKAKVYRDKAGVEFTITPDKRAELNAMNAKDRLAELKKISKGANLEEVGLKTGEKTNLMGKVPGLKKWGKTSETVGKLEGDMTGATAKATDETHFFPEFENKRREKAAAYAERLHDRWKAKPKAKAEKPEPAEAPQPVAKAPETLTPLQERLKDNTKGVQNYISKKYKTEEGANKALENFRKNNPNEANKSDKEIFSIMKVRALKQGGDILKAQLGASVGFTMPQRNYQGLNALKLTTPEIKEVDNSADIQNALTKGWTGVLRGVNAPQSVVSGTTVDLTKGKNKLKGLSQFLLNKSPEMLQAGQFIQSQRGTDRLKEFTKVDAPVMKHTKLESTPIREDLQQKSAIQSRIADLANTRINTGDANQALGFKLSASKQGSDLLNQYGQQRSANLAQQRQEQLAIDRMNAQGSDYVNNMNEQARAQAANMERQALGMLENRKQQNAETMMGVASQKAAQAKQYAQQRDLLKLGTENPTYQSYLTVLTDPNSSEEAKNIARAQLNKLNTQMKLEQLKIMNR